MSVWICLVCASLLSCAGQLWHEPVARRHWLGVGLIVVGIVILGTSV